MEIDLWTSLKGIIETPIEYESKHLIEIKYKNKRNNKAIPCAYKQFHFENVT
jgi:hypothetical protein